MTRGLIKVSAAIRIRVAALVCGAVLLCANAVVAADQAKALAYRTLDPAQFQNTVKNWNDAKYPVLVAVIRNLDEWNAVFQPTPVMGTNRPFAPDAVLFEREAILLAARVMPAAPGWQHALQVGKVLQTPDRLTLAYRYAKSARAASFTVKHYLMVRVPRGLWQQVVFIENGATVGTLDIGKGQWSLPAAGAADDSHETRERPR